MSKIDHEHGTMSSYVIGFILSLIFTFIPYYLVVNQVITGTSLLVTILGFAVIQMIIQITFFLHIGRGPKPNWNLFFFISTVGIILLVIGASIMIMNNLHYNMAPTDKVKKIVNDEAIYQVNGQLTGACQQLYASHIIIITDEQLDPLQMITEKCDTLTFSNESDETLKITFGTPSNQSPYAGENELTIRPGQGETITLSDTGTFQFYSSLQADTLGYFSVTE